jgi:hypothetical protein
LHSPWGYIFLLQEKIGCSHDYLLWKESWLNLQMKISDSVRYGKKKTPKPKELVTEEDFKNFFDLQ